MPTAVFNAEMACGGCSGACTRILNKMEGVSSVNADLETQKITVEYTESAETTPDAMLAKLKGAHRPRLPKCIRRARGGGDDTGRHHRRRAGWGEKAGKAVSLA